MAQFPLIDQASLAMIPGAYKESKVYSQLPTDGSGDFTFSRGTDNATIVNEEGLIEKGYENLLTYSNDFSNPAWDKNNATMTSGQTGYDGSSDAWLFKSTSNACNTIQYIAPSGVQTFSVYAKEGTANWLRILGDASTDYVAFFNLSGSGSVGTTSGEIDAKIESIGSGWFRCSITGNATISRLIINIADSDGGVAGLSAGDNIYIQDAQLNPGLVAYPYLETTTAPAYGGITANQPRLNYTGDCPSLFLEEGRTNLVEHSEYITLPQGLATIEYNGGISPEGVNNAIRVVEDTSTTFHTLRSSATIANTNSHTLSVFVKTNGVRDTINLRSGVSSNIYTSSIFTLSGSGSYAGSDGGIESYGNGWYRIHWTFSHTQTGTSTLFLNASYYVGTGQEWFYYGSQVEEGSTPSSYIPTYGSAQTRTAETLTATKTLPSEGTLYINVGGTTQPKLSVLGEFFDASTTENKVAIAYSATALKISHNGSIVVDKTGSYDVSSLTEIDLGHDGGTDQADTSIGEFITFGSFLTTTELNALTQ